MARSGSSKDPDCKKDDDARAASATLEGVRHYQTGSEEKRCAQERD